MKLTALDRILGLGLAGVLAGILAGPASAETPGEFYKGKDVTVVVAAAAGGLADSVARVFVARMAEHMPGHPQMIVVNKPGAGGMVAASQLEKTEAKDGTTIGFLLGNDITTPLVTDKNAQFDPRKVQWLGAIDSGDYPYAFYVSKNSPVQSAEDLKTKKLVVGSTSFTNYNRVFPAMMNKYMGTNIDIVAGYKGSGEVYLALERGEVDGWFEGSHAILSPVNKLGQMIKDGEIKPIMLMGDEPDEDIPNLPVVMSGIDGDDNRDVADFILASSAIGRPLAVPAQVPADRVAALRKAFDDTFADADFGAYMMKTVNTPVARRQSAEYLGQKIDKFYKASDAVLEQVRSFMVEQ